MKRKSLLILIFGIFAVFWAIGTYNVSYAACSNCKAGKHTSCSSKGYTQVENPTWHYIYCCCGKVAQQHENHTVSGYLNTSTYCYKCVCGYKALHNKSKVVLAGFGAGMSGAAMSADLSFTKLLDVYEI